MERPGFDAPFGCTKPETVQRPIWVPLLAERGVALAREKVYRLVVYVPERLSLTTLVALCDILSCGPAELIEAYLAKRGQPPRLGAAGTAPPRPTRARVLPTAGN
jgi:DNA-binding Xre family transcriptional regulator